MEPLHRQAALIAAGCVLASWSASAADAASVCAASLGPPRATLAVIIGANAAPKKEKLVELQFGDDDAVRFYRFIRLMRPDATALLLARPDETVWQRFPEAVRWRAEKNIRPPTLPALEEALAELAKKAGELAREKRGVDFYFVFAGHGGVLDDGRGGLYLEDGVFSRKDLYDKIIHAFPGVDKHIILDACHAALAASSRGGNEHVERMRDLEDIRFQSGVGLVAATNPTGRVKEWERYRGGIFSHEVLSGLLGGADVDGDDCITYRELVAFLRAANDGIHVAAAKIDVISAPPDRDPDFVVADWRGTSQPRFTVPDGATGHIWVEDQQLERWLETNRPPGQPLRIVMTPGEIHYLRGEANGAPICFQQRDLGQPAAVVACQAGQDRSDDKEPGVGNILATGLFRTPFGPGVLAGLGSPPWLPAESRQGAEGDEPPHSRLWVWMTIGAAALTAGAVSIYLSQRSVTCPGGADCR